MKIACYIEWVKCISDISRGCESREEGGEEEIEKLKEGKGKKMNKKNKGWFKQFNNYNKIKTNNKI